MFGGPDEEVGGGADGIWARVRVERMDRSSEATERRVRYLEAIDICLLLFLSLEE